MTFEKRLPAFDDAIGKQASLEKVLGGFEFLEGPIWHPTRHYLLFSDIQASQQYRMCNGTNLEVFRKPSNQANGNCFDLSGAVISCEHATSQLVRHDHGGKRVRPIATHFESCELNSPNDVICDSKGRIWFTDPTFGRIREDLGVLREQELSFQGVFRLDPDGGLHAVATDFEQPNGLCLSPDETRLFVNDSWASHIRVFDISTDGTLRSGAVWSDVTGTGAGVPDGMKSTRDGHVLCNGPGGVHVFNEKGDCLGVILTPEKSTNFCFGGNHLRTLFITATTSIYKIDTQLDGLPSMLHKRAEG